MDEGVSFTSWPLYPGIHSTGRWVSPRPHMGHFGEETTLSSIPGIETPGSVNL